MNSEIDFEISDYKPSSIEGLMEVTLTATQGNRTHQRSYFVSKDGG